VCSSLSAGSGGSSISSWTDHPVAHKKNLCEILDTQTTLIVVVMNHVGEKPGTSRELPGGIGLLSGRKMGRESSTPRCLVSPLALVLP